MNKHVSPKSVKIVPTIFRGVTKVEMELVNMTPAMACRLRDNPLEGQRTVVARHVALIEKLVESGEFNPLDPMTIIRDNKTGREVLINGYHRATMIARRASDFPIMVQTIYTNDFEADAKFFYATYDQAKRRTMENMIEFFGDHKSFVMTPAEANRVATAGILIDNGYPNFLCGLDAKSKSVDYRRKLLRKYGKVAEKVYADLGPVMRKKKSAIGKVMKRADTFAIILGTYVDNGASDEIRDMWRAIADSVGFKTLGDPARILAEDMLTETWVNGSNKGRREAVDRMFDDRLAGRERARMSPYASKSKS